MKNTSARLACLLALSTTACADLEVPEGAAGGAADDLSLGDDVAVVKQELGSWSKRYQGQLQGGYASLGPAYMVVANGPGICDRDVEVVYTQGEVAVPAPLLPDTAGCENVTGVYGGNNEVLIADSATKRLWRLILDAQWNWFWTQIATTPGTQTYVIRNSSTHVYWGDSMGVHKAPIGGGAVTTLAGPEMTLVDLDGSNLYIQRYNETRDNYTLFSQPVAGGAPTSLRTMSDAFSWSFDFNSTHIYFEQTKENDWHRIYKMPKDGNNVSVFAEVPYGADWIHSIEANETHVYWVQSEEDRVQRRRISDAQHSSIHCKEEVCSDIVLTSSYLYVLGQDNGPDEKSIWRGQL